MIFVIIHGLYVARKAFEFSHEDIHHEQIVFLSVNYTSTLTLNFEEHSVKITGVRYLPKLLDFDLSKGTHMDENFMEPNFYDSRDLNFLEQYVLSRFTRFKQIIMELTGSTVYKRAKRSDRNNHAALANLLDDDWFKDSIRFVDNIGQKIETRCIGCTQPAKSRIENTDLTFCEKCPELYESMYTLFK